MARFAHELVKFRSSVPGQKGEVRIFFLKSSKGKLVGVELGLGEENGRSSCVAIEMVVKLSNVQEIG